MALSSGLTLALSNTFIKKATLFTVGELSIFRYFLQLCIMLFLVRYNRRPYFGDKNQRFLLIVRGLVGTVGILFLHISIKFIDPSDSAALFNTRIVIVSILARFLLNEKISLVHIVSLILTIAGNSLICNIKKNFKSFYFIYRSLADFPANIHISNKIKKTFKF